LKERERKVGRGMMIWCENKMKKKQLRVKVRKTIKI
jgi:hypothetical protein